MADLDKKADDKFPSVKKNNFSKSEEEDYGYDFFPNRSVLPEKTPNTTEREDQSKFSILKTIFTGQARQTLKCESDVLWCAENGMYK